MAGLTHTQKVTAFNQYKYCFQAKYWTYAFQSLGVNWAYKPCHVWFIVSGIYLITPSYTNEYCNGGYDIIPIFFSVLRSILCKEFRELVLRVRY